MKNSALSLNKLVPPKPLIALESFLEDFVYSQKGPACIKLPEKTTQIGKYEVCNPAIAHRDGISIQDYVGLTAYDVGEKLHYEKSVLSNALEMDTKIFNGILPYVRYTQSIPTDDGLFSIEEIIKRPIFNKDHKVIGLLSCGNDITEQVELSYLFSKYQKQYSEKVAIQYFLRHIGIENLFYTIPKKEEVEVLIFMLKSSATEYIVKEIPLSAKVIDECKGRLADNLKSVSLNDLVVQLRMHNELQGIS